MLYQIRIKVVSCLFKQRQLTKELVLNCYSNENMVQSGMMHIEDGFLINKVSLNMKITEQDMNKDHEIIGMIYENQEQQIGHFRVNLMENDDYKMRRIKIQSNIFDKAFLQAYVLIVPLQLMDEDHDTKIYIQNCSNLINTKNNLKIQKKLFVQSSLTNITQDEDLQDQQYSNSKNKQENQSIISQNINNLMILNQILEGKNKTLQFQLEQWRLKNSQLQQKISSMELKMLQLNMKIQEMQQANSQMDHKALIKEHQRLFTINLQNQMQIEQLKNQIKSIQHQKCDLSLKLSQFNANFTQKNEQLNKKQDIILTLTKKCNQLEENMSKTERSINVQNKAYSIDEIVDELSKYSQTVRKYKNFNQSSINRSTLTESNKKQSKTGSNKKVEINYSKSINNRKVASKKNYQLDMIQNKDRFNNQENTYSLTDR